MIVQGESFSIDPYILYYFLLKTSDSYYLMDGNNTQKIVTIPNKHEGLVCYQ